MIKLYGQLTERAVFDTYVLSQKRGLRPTHWIAGHGAICDIEKMNGNSGQWQFPLDFGKNTGSLLGVPISEPTDDNRSLMLMSNTVVIGSIQVFDLPKMGGRIPHVTTCILEMLDDKCIYLDYELITPEVGLEMKVSDMAKVVSAGTARFVL